MDISLSEQIAQAAAVIKTGGVVCFPTQSLYGLGADPFSRAAVDKVYAVKNRDEKEPLLILIPDMSWVNRLAFTSKLALKFMERFWPGPLTIILEAKEALPASAGSDKIGLRMDNHPAACALVQAVGAPVTATSANLSGAPAVGNLALLDDSFKRRLDYILDAGPLPKGYGSTIIDVSNGGMSIDIIRIGDVPIHALRI